MRRALCFYVGIVLSVVHIIPMSANTFASTMCGSIVFAAATTMLALARPNA